MNNIKTTIAKAKKVLDRVESGVVDSDTPFITMVHADGKRKTKKTAKRVSAIYGDWRKGAAKGPMATSRERCKKGDAFRSGVKGC